MKEGSEQTHIGVIIPSASANGVVKIKTIGSS